jgi:hypothetical protein
LDEISAREEPDLSPDEVDERDAARATTARTRPRIAYLLTRTGPTSEERTELAGLMTKDAAAERELADLGVARSRRQLASIDAVRAAIPVDAALVVWADVGEAPDGVSEHWGCVVRQKADPSWHRLPGTGVDKTWTAADDDLPRSTRSALIGAGGDPVAAARALYAQRLAPLEPALAGVKRLFVVPTGPMAGFPVEALTDRYIVSYVASGSFLAKLAGRPRSAVEGILAIGDPTFRGTGAAPAPPPPGGVLVRQVVPTGAAAIAGVRAGDVLLKYAGTDLKSAAALDRLVEEQAAAEAVTLTIWRAPTDGRNLSTLARRVRPGPLGVVLDPAPAAEALTARRVTDRLLARARDGEHLAELPGTAAELARLAALFPGKATILSRANASETELGRLWAAGKLPTYRYLHFATHGEANDVRAFESTLYLARPPEAPQRPDHAGLGGAEQPTIDGRLTAGKVLRFWQLDAELVTLSACETGLGRNGGGDGLLGFAQAFLTAGSRAVCLSLWKVEDASSVLLMERFYRNLLGKRGDLPAPLGKAAALAEAKQWLRGLTAEEAAKLLTDLTGGVARGLGKEAVKISPADPKAPTVQGAPRPFSHPRFWAAFILIGDPD